MRLVDDHGVDSIDAMQIVTLLKGRYRQFMDGSQSLLITADRELARVARLESPKVWECTADPQPPRDSPGIDCNLVAIRAAARNQLELSVDWK